MAEARRGAGFIPDAQRRVAARQHGEARGEQEGNLLQRQRQA